MSQDTWLHFALGFGTRITEVAQLDKELGKCRVRMKAPWILLFIPVFGIRDGLPIICLIFLEGPQFPWCFHMWSSEAAGLWVSLCCFGTMFGFGVRSTLGAFSGGDVGTGAEPCLLPATQCLATEVSSLLLSRRLLPEAEDPG